MHDGDPELGANHRTGCRRIDVADDDDPVGAMFHADFFVGDHDIAGLLGMRATANTEVEIRGRNAKILQDRIGHVLVVMLPGVDQDGFRPVGRFERMVERGYFHEIRSRGGDEMDGFQEISIVQSINI